MKRAFEVSIENKPKWNACVSFTINECMKEDPDMLVSVLYEKCVKNFKTNNYPLEKTVAAKAKRVKLNQQREARAQARLKEDPAKAAFIKSETQKLKEEYPYKNKNQLREMAIHNWCLMKDKENVKKNE